MPLALACRADMASPAAARPGLRVWMPLLVGAMCCAGVVLFVAPDRLERVVIAVDGGAPAVAALQAALVRQATDPAEQLVTAAAGITHPARRPGGPLAAPAPPLLALARQTIAALQGMATPAAPPSPGLDPATRATRRAALVQDGRDADRDEASLSTALSGTVRDIAALQRDQAMRPDAPADPVQPLLAQLQLKRIDLAARYTADFPGIAITDDEIARLQALQAHDRAALRPAPPDLAAPLATLQGEQRRLQGLLAASQGRRATLAARIAGLDALPDAAPPPAPAPRYTITDADSTSLPDARPALLAGVAALSLSLAAAAGWWRRAQPHTRLPPLALPAQVQAVEQALRLPVLRRLDVNGRPLLAGWVAQDRGRAALERDRG